MQNFVPNADNLSSESITVNCLNTNEDTAFLSCE